LNPTALKCGVFEPFIPKPAPEAYLTPCYP
jgi:hypothetical protein